MRPRGSSGLPECARGCFRRARSRHRIPSRPHATPSQRKGRRRPGALAGASSRTASTARSPCQGKVRARRGPAANTAGEGPWRTGLAQPSGSHCSRRPAMTVRMTAAAARPPSRERTSGRHGRGSAWPSRRVKDRQGQEPRGPQHGQLGHPAPRAAHLRVDPGSVGRDPTLARTGFQPVALPPP